MSFTSLFFFIITILTLLLYFLFPLKYRWLVLLAASCTFYCAAAGKKAFLVALVSIAVSYFCAIRMEKAAEDKKKRHLILTVGLLIVLGILVVVKLKNFAPTMLSMVIVPLGVSYYSLSLIGYLADIYYKKGKAEKNFLKLTLYTLYFLKIVQGPFSKFREIGPKLIEGHKFSYQNLCFGIQRILWGYFKKLVIADRAAMITSSVFSDFASYDKGGAILLMITLLATVRHYCDFSGYMDIVIGISEIMGIELDENFLQPFFSKSAAEFWRRWHITLGVWFKDYVYMPLVISPRIIKISTWFRKRFGKRAGKNVLIIIPLAATWICTGLWHGTGIDYVIWGAYWGTIIIISNVFAPEMKKLVKVLHINTSVGDWQLFQTLRTFCIFVFGLLISTFIGFQSLGRYFKILFTSPGISRLLDGSILSMGLSKADFVILLLSILLLFIVELRQLKGSVRGQIASLHAPCRWVLFVLLFLFLMLFGIYGGSYSTVGFEYARF